jgi:hypothetical protein
METPRAKTSGVFVDVRHGANMLAAVERWTLSFGDFVIL